MRFAILALLTTLTLTAVSPADAALELMPLPRSIEAGEGVYEIDSGFTVNLEGAGATERLRRATVRMLRRLSDRSGLFFEPAVFLELEGRADAELVVSAGRAAALRLGEDESYRLTVSERGARLEAATDVGALRGLETFLQLVALDERGVVVPRVSIDDAPRFPWRGLMIDSSRHFMPLDMLRRNLDGMAAVKLNVLHWHLADDQGFRVESKVHPKLHQLGSDGLYYTQRQIREILDYAADRGIRVVPEFDLPGHATSWLTAYPELGSQPGPYEIERQWGIFKPTVDPTRETTYEFLAALFAEMAQLFDDEFLHIGGDENTGEHWNENPQIRAFMEENGYEDTHALQQYFSLRLQQILARLGKRMVGWDEILQPELPKSIVIQSWRGRESLYQAARQGYSGILSNGYYIDLIQPTDFHYLNDPLPGDAPVTEEEAARILGGEATMWAEYVTHETVDSRIWPRTAAIAERLWSPAAVRDVEAMYRRLDRVSLLLEELGLEHEKNQAMLLRRLCQCREVEALEVLLGTVEPVKIYRRGQQRAYTQFSPLTRAVDAARPDAAPARRFRSTVARLLEHDSPDAADLDAARSWLRRWHANHATLLPTLLDSPALAEVTSLSADLSAVSMLALEALEMLAAGKEPPEGWLAPGLERLEAARLPRGQLELMIVDAAERLVCAAAGAAEAECPPPAEEPAGGTAPH